MSGRLRISDNDRQNKGRLKFRSGGQHAHYVVVDGVRHDRQQEEEANAQSATRRWLVMLAFKIHGIGIR